jgi:hypothetical protein
LRQISASHSTAGRKIPRLNDLQRAANDSSGTKQAFGRKLRRIIAGSGRTIFPQGKFLGFKPRSSAFSKKTSRRKPALD